MTSNTIKIHQQLPNEVLIALEYTTKTRSQRSLYAVALHARGWTQTAIANALGVSREAVRQKLSKIELKDAIEFVVSLDLPVPLPPQREKAVKIYTEPAPETLQRLLELQPFAQQVRSNSTRYRKEAEEYTWLLNYSHTVEGVSVYRLAKRLGVTPGAVRFRLARYGYMPPLTATTSKVYTPIKTENRMELEDDR